MTGTNFAGSVTSTNGLNVGQLPGNGEGAPRAHTAVIVCTAVVVATWLDGIANADSDPARITHVAVTRRRAFRLVCSKNGFILILLFISIFVLEERARRSTADP